MNLPSQHEDESSNGLPTVEALNQDPTILLSEEQKQQVYDLIMQLVEAVRVESGDVFAALEQTVDDLVTALEEEIITNPTMIALMDIMASALPPGPVRYNLPLIMIDLLDTMQDSIYNDLFDADIAAHSSR